MVSWLQSLVSPCSQSATVLVVTKAEQQSTLRLLVFKHRKTKSKLDIPAQVAPDLHCLDCNHGVLVFVCSNTDEFDIPEAGYLNLQVMMEMARSTIR